MLDIFLTVMTAAAVICSIFGGSIEKLSESALSGCADAVKLCITLAGSMGLWGGLMNVADKCGITQKISRLISVPLSRLFKTSRSTETMQHISMNTAANLMGLGNAATPLGLKAMKSLSKNSRDPKETAYLVLLNTASIQLIPVTVAAMRLSHGCKTPWDCTLPTIVVSAAALAAGLVTVTILYGKRGRSYGADDTSDNTRDTDMRIDKKD